MKNKDPQTGVELRDDALDRVEQNANEKWKGFALQTVEWLCRNRDEFTTDAVWSMLDCSEAETHEPRAMGAIVQKAAANGWCESTERTHNSIRPNCHSRPVRVWRSLLRAMTLDDVSQQITTITELREQRDFLLEQLEGHQDLAPMRMVIRAYNDKWRKD